MKYDKTEIKILKITKAGVHIFYTNAAATSKIYLPEG
jgi:hypothetical protein